jgi:hypothetical protein
MLPKWQRNKSHWAVWLLQIDRMGQSQQNHDGKSKSVFPVFLISYSGLGPQNHSIRDTLAVARKHH